MANIKSNKKRHAQDEKKRVLNHSKNSEVRTRVKKARSSSDEKQLPEVYSCADKAAKRGRIHKNKANRIKSRTTKAVTKSKK